MKIQEKDRYHGSALTQIVEHKSFKALNKADEKYGHYQVNHDRRLLTKYSKATPGPWSFTFQPDDIRTMNDDMRRKDGRTFACLVCGEETVCILDEGELDDLIDRDNVAVQWIRIEVPPAGRMHVRGSKGALERTVAHNSFPDKVFR